MTVTTDAIFNFWTLDISKTNQGTKLKCWYVGRLLKRFVTAADCTRRHPSYTHSFSLIAHQDSCYVTIHNDPALTWYEAAHKCNGLRGDLAVFDAQNTSDVDFISADKIPSTCAWVGLVKKFFYWTVILRKYPSQLSSSSSSSSTNDIVCSKNTTEQDSKVKDSDATNSCHRNVQIPL